MERRARGYGLQPDEFADRVEFDRAYLDAVLGEEPTPRASPGPIGFDGSAARRTTGLAYNAPDPVRGGVEQGVQDLGVLAARAGRDVKGVISAVGQDQGRPLAEA